MTCENTDAAALTREFDFVMARSAYAPDPRGAATARFRFTLPQPASAAALFVVKSTHVDEWIYRGPFAAELVLPFDERLGGAGGFDTLSFHLLDPDAQRLCAWVNESGERYWVDGASIGIDLLEHGEFDPDGLFRQHEVAFGPASDPPPQGRVPPGTAQRA